MREDRDQRAFLIGAPHSNSGKTVITLGLIKALKDKGLNIKPFKCGPDYIDPMHHSNIAGTSSYNLDTWFSEGEHVKSIFRSKSKGVDISIVEGVMGLFDGADRDRGSSAEVAKLLKIPVVMVVDARSTAYSVAPLLYGFKNFDKDLNVVGVIFNKVSGDSHYSFLKNAADDVGVTSLGYIPRDENLHFESRHLGLHMPQDLNCNSSICRAAELVNKHIDIEKLFEITTTDGVEAEEFGKVEKGELKFAIAKDSAFNFIYPANIDQLEQLGEVIYFSPLDDSVVPEADLLWFPGGYPELYADRLSSNRSMIDSIRRFSDRGGAIVAECGGMIYLGKEMISSEEVTIPMCNLFNYTTSAYNMKLTLGYREVKIEDRLFRGHEFHYSKLKKDYESDGSIEVVSARGKRLDMAIFRKEHCWASYMHLYLGEAKKMKEFLAIVMGVE